MTNEEGRGLDRSTLTWGRYRRICLKAARLYAEHLDEPGAAAYLEQCGTVVQPREEELAVPPETVFGLAYEVEPLLAAAVKRLLIEVCEVQLSLSKMSPALVVICYARDADWIDPRRRITEGSADLVEKLRLLSAGLHTIQAINRDRIALGVTVPFGVG